MPTLQLHRTTLAMFRLLGTALAGPIAFLAWASPFKRQHGADTTMGSGAAGCGLVCALTPSQALAPRDMRQASRTADDALNAARDPVPPSTEAEIEDCVAALQARSGEWAALTCAERAALLRACIKTLRASMHALASETVAAKGSYGAGSGEEKCVSYLSHPFAPLLTRLTHPFAGLRCCPCCWPWTSMQRRCRRVAHLLPSASSDAATASGSQTSGLAGPHPSHIRAPCTACLPCCLQPAHSSSLPLVHQATARRLAAVAFGGIKAEVWIKPGAEPTQGAHAQQ